MICIKGSIKNNIINYSTIEWKKAGYSGFPLRSRQFGSKQGMVCVCVCACVRACVFFSCFCLLLLLWLFSSFFFFIIFFFLDEIRNARKYFAKRQKRSSCCRDQVKYKDILDMFSRHGSAVVSKSALWTVKPMKCRFESLRWNFFFSYFVVVVVVVGIDVLLIS